MKKHLSSFAAALLLVSISPLHATTISGTFSGVVTGKGGVIFPYALGAPVAGTFHYDSNPLVVDYSFVVEIDGEGFAGWNSLLNGLSFSVDANGFPQFGHAAGLWDLGINGGNLGFVTFGDNYGSAQVTYATPDAGTTLSLMGIVLAGLVVVAATEGVRLRKLS